LAAVLRRLKMTRKNYLAVVLMAVCLTGLAATATAIRAEDGPPPGWTAEDWADLSPDEKADELNNYPIGDGTPEEKTAWIDSNPEELMDAEVDAMSQEEGTGVDLSRGVQEGATTSIGRGIYVYQNSWQDLNSVEDTLIQAYAGSLLTTPCTGVVVINRIAWPASDAAEHIGTVTVQQFELMGPIKVTGASGTYVTLFAADGSLGILNAEDGSIKWIPRAHPAPLDDTQCSQM
jgi:hypothetical protein